MKQQDFTKEKFVLKVPLYCDRDTAFKLVASASGMEAWFLGKVEYFDQSGNAIADGKTLHKGDTFNWTWQKGHKISGKVLEYQEGEKFEFTFGSIFSVAITAAEIEPGKITEIKLTQLNHDAGPSSEFGFMNCCVCWTFFLTNLKSVAENHIDLRETQLTDESFINL